MSIVIADVALGSLAARIVFQPIEETARVFFSKTLSSNTDAAKESVKSKQAHGALESAASVLMNLLLAFSHLLILLITFAPPYLPLALKLALPSRYLNTSAPSILHTYVYYIPTMAFNGVLEAFFASTATPADLRKQSRWMLVFSLVFVLGAVALARGLGLGDSGLVWANVANLWLRASYAWLFIRRYFASKGAGSLVALRRAIPPVGVLAAFALSAFATRLSYNANRDAPLTIPGQFRHIVVGATCVASCLVAW